LGSHSSTVVQFQKSLPSGHFLTAFINSMYSMTVIVAGYVYNTGCCDFWDHASAATLGDDNVNGVDDYTAQFHNQKTLAAFLKKELNLDYTPADKESEFLPYTTIDKISFLKRRFVESEHGILCPLELPSILHAMYYVRPSREAPMERIVEDLLQRALGELALHDDNVWERWSMVVIGELKKLGKSPLFGSQKSEWLVNMLNRRDPAWGSLQIRLRDISHTVDDFEVEQGQGGS